MRKLTQITTFVAVFAIFAIPAFSDTLVLKNGQRISGYFEGGSARVIKFNANGLTKDYDLLAVQEIQFGDDKTTSTTSTTSTPARSATSTTSPTTSDPRLLPSSERPPARPASSSAANTAYTIPTGSKI